MLSGPRGCIDISMSLILVHEQVCARAFRCSTKAAVFLGELAHAECTDTIAEAGLGLL